MTSQRIASSSIISPVEEVLAEDFVYDKTGEDHYVSPCVLFGVSNDPDVAECGKEIFGCVKEHYFLQNTRQQVREINLRFDYDVHYDDDQQDLEDILDFIEATMVEHLAASIGLEHCQQSAEESTVQAAQESTVSLSGSNRRQRRRRLTSPNKDMEESAIDKVKDAIVAVSSDPIDLPAETGKKGARTNHLQLEEENLWNPLDQLTMVMHVFTFIRMLRIRYWK